MKQGVQKKLVRLQTYVPSSLAKQVEEDAEKNHRPVAGEIWYILEQYFKTQQRTEEHRKPIQEGEEQAKTV